jgi:HNH endonuclease
VADKVEIDWEKVQGRQRGQVLADELSRAELRAYFTPRWWLRLLIKRDGPDCALCHEPVDYSVKDPENPACWTFDHIIPRSEGGRSVPANLRIAHKRCNEARGNGHPPPVLEGRVTGPSGGCGGCDAPDNGRGGAAFCTGCWEMLPPGLQAPLKVPPWNGNQDFRLRYDAAVAEAYAYLRGASPRLPVS